MDRLHIQGPTKLQGKVTVSGAKNVALPILFTALLAEELVEIQNVLKLKDIDTSMKLLSQLGTKIGRNGSMYIDAHGASVFCTPYDLVKTMRASIWALGPLVACFGQGRVSLPDSCMIGVRSVDLHIPDLEQLGATTKLREGYAKVSADGRLKGVHIVMDKVNIGMTVAIMCTAALAEGTAIIENAAREPEIVDTANLLIMLDAEISGQGTDRTVIEGVERLGDGVYRMLPDHIETDTFLVVAVVSCGKIICRNTQSDILDTVLAKLRDAGVDIEVGEGWISLDMYGKRLKAVNVRIAPHPTFLTDMRAQSTLLNLVTEGTGFITETVFGNRFMHVPELSRMGAHTETKSNTVTYYGVEKPSDVQVMTTDLHTSTSLVLVSYIVEGATVVDRIYHIDHGYERIEDKLRALGADTEHVKGE